MNSFVVVLAEAEFIDEGKNQILAGVDKLYCPTSEVNSEQ